MIGDILYWLIFLYFFGLMPTFGIVFLTYWIIGAGKFDYAPDLSEMNEQQTRTLYLRFFLVATIIGIIAYRLRYGTGLWEILFS